MNRLLNSLFVFTAILSFTACSPAKDSDARPEVTLYGVSSGRDVTLNMVFDLENCGRLCDKPTAIVLLKTPGETVKPWTGFSSGDFFVLVDSKNNSIVYGNYSYKNVMAAGEKRVVPAFRRQGSGEKAIGGLEGNIFLCAAEQDGRKIGEMQYGYVVSPSGEKRTLLLHRLTGSNGKWITALGDKIYQQEANGQLTQVGWVDWRKIIPPAGNPLVILMTKGMGKNGKWAGRYDGKLYRDM